MELDPGDTLARSYYASFLICQKRLDAAVTEAQRAVERDPLSGFSRFVLALALIAGRRFDAGMVEARLGIEIDLDAAPPRGLGPGW